MLGAILKYYAALLDLGAQLPRLRHCHSQWFIDIHVLAIPGGLERDGHMPMIGGEYGDSVDIITPNYLSDVGNRPAAVIAVFFVQTGGKIVTSVLERVHRS